MISSDIESVIREFGPAKWNRIESDNAAAGVFFLNVTPLPSPNELEKVIADICTGGIPVYVKGGKVYHSEECQARRHDIQNASVKRSLRRLKEETFNVAIHPNIAVGPLLKEPLLGGQPIAIAFDPAITFMNFPDHPHLSMGGPERLLPGTQYFLPDSICYTNNPNGLGNTQTERLLAALDEITIWLLRHQIWMATRELTGHGIWIGPHEGQLDPEWFPSRLNPLGPCRCGSRKTYASCHMTSDLETVKQKYGDTSVTNLKKHIDSGWWTKAVYMPQKNLFEDLKQKQ